MDCLGGVPILRDMIKRPEIVRMRGTVRHMLAVVSRLKETTKGKTTLLTP